MRWGIPAHTLKDGVEVDEACIAEAFCDELEADEGGLGEVLGDV